MAGEKVLVIDDSAETLQFIREHVLAPHGYIFLGARDGQEGLRKALAENPDLIVMDLQVPKMTGLEVLKALQERQCDIPVILMTVHGSEEIVVQAFRLGAKDYIIKPFEVEEMLEAIDRALAEKRFMSKETRDVAQQLERRVKELNILYDVGKSVTSLLDLEKVLNRIVEAAVSVTGAEEGSLLLVDKDTGELYLRAARGLGEEFARGFRVKVEHSIVGQVVKTGKPILQSAQDAETLKVKTGYQVRSLVNVPLKAKDEVIGVLTVNNKTSSRPFTDNDVDLLSALADYATIAIVNAQLYEETKRWSVELEQKVEERARELRTALEEVRNLATELERKVKELSVLYTIGQSMTSLLNLEELLNRIVEAAVFVTGAEEGSLLLVYKDTGELYLRAARNLGDKLARGFRLKVEHSIAGQVVKTGQPILQSTQDEEMLKVKTGYLVKSLVNVPLKAKNRVIGVLAVDNKISSRPFTDNDVVLLSALADYAAIAIENAWLYKDIEDKAAQLDTLLEIAQSTTSQLDPEVVLQMIVDSAVTKLGADVATLYLYDPIQDEFPAPVIAGHIDHPEEMLPPTKDSIVYRMLRQEGLYLAHDAQHDEVMTRGFTQRESIQSSAGFPLRVGGEPVGAMFVNYRKPHWFTEGEKNIFTLFAQSAAIAIQNAQLYKRVSEGLETASAMAWAGTAASLWAHEVQQITFGICTEVATLRDRISDREVQEILGHIEIMSNALAEVVPSLPSRDAEEAVDLARVLKDVLKKRSKELLERNIQVQSNLGTLPRVRANHSWLVEVFDGLTKNALRAMPGGGNLAFTGRVLSSRVLIDVVDSGKGVPDHLRNQLYKGRVVDPERGGMGIGLLLVKTILNRYGGDIGLPYSDERGNVFPVQLLLAR